MRPVILGVLVGLAGCATYPCDTDVLACEDGDALQIDPTCEAEGELALAVHENESEAPLSGDAWPVVHHGTQGALHFALALELQGIDPEHREVEVTLRVEACDDDICEDTSMIVSRTLVADDEVLEGDGDVAQLHDVILVLDEAPPEDARLVVEARDACGRTATRVFAS